MLRHQGGERVKAGFYLNLDSWEINTISGTEGGMLEGDSASRFLRIPVIGMLVFAPLMGAVFAIFLPFIGLALVAQYVATKAWSGARQMAHATVGALGPAWHPAAAHLSGTPDEKKKEGPEEATRAAEARLDSLEREIAGEAERKKTPRA